MNQKVDRFSKQYTKEGIGRRYCTFELSTQRAAPVAKEEYVNNKTCTHNLGYGVQKIKLYEGLEFCAAKMVSRPF